MLGYCLTGSFSAHNAPASIKITAITMAKRGRRIKNFAVKDLLSAPLNNNFTGLHAFDSSLSAGNAERLDAPYVNTVPSTT